MQRHVHPNDDITKLEKKIKDRGEDLWNFNDGNRFNGLGRKIVFYSDGRRIINFKLLVAVTMKLLMAFDGYFWV